MPSKIESDVVAKTGRRSMLLGATAVVATLAAERALAAPKPAPKPAQPQHKHAHARSRFAGVADAALHCVKAGEECQRHCLVAIKGGDTTMAACLASVTDMLALCAVTAGMATRESSQFAQLAKVCAAVCEECEKECQKHAKHPECAECAKSCRACADACKKVAA